MAMVWHWYAYLCDCVCANWNEDSQVVNSDSELRNVKVEPDLLRVSGALCPTHCYEHSRLGRDFWLNEVCVSHFTADFESLSL
mmetsp:Transcript_26243/g.42507  ORF Transcript_26243/g.42507 Transcript_26243/m.42507 type:complete len:83 (-) Transcript_26243:33-281(-)